MLDAACRLVLDEVSLPGSAPGGKVEFKRTLIISFLFKFYLEVSQLLRRMVSELTMYFPALGARGIPKVEATTPCPMAVEQKRQPRLGTRGLAGPTSGCLLMACSLGESCK